MKKKEQQNKMSLDRYFIKYTSLNVWNSRRLHLEGRQTRDKSKHIKTIFYPLLISVPDEIK